MWEKILIQLLPLIIGAITPELREFLDSTIQELERKAKATRSPWDDILVQILRGVLVQKK